MDKLLNNLSIDESHLKLEVGEKAFYVRKYLLVHRSTYFATMFRNNELTEDSFRIEDINVSVFEEILKSLHSGIVPDMDVQMANQWMSVIERFGFSSLKVCMILQCHIKTVNVAITSTLPELYLRIDF